MKNKKRFRIIFFSVLGAILLASILLNVYFAFFSKMSYLQNPYEIYIMEAGIIESHLQFQSGEDIEIEYDFENPDYKTLKEKYNIEKIAGCGSDFERAVRLMDEFSPRLTHKSVFDYDVEFRTLPLLEYSLNNKRRGINCRAKAQILNEMCLALGIYSRKVWIKPLSIYDDDCHVVNEIWDRTTKKWIMLDITNDMFWVDENGTPLSILEIRQKGTNREFCTPITPSEFKSDMTTKQLEKIQKKHGGNLLYIMKNMVFMEYLDNYTAGESETIYILLPKNLETKRERFISESAVQKSPLTE